MNPLDLFNQVKELIRNKKISKLQKHLLQVIKNSLENTSPKLNSWISGSEGLDGPRWKD